MRDLMWLTDKSTPEPTTGCWLWLRAMTTGGYGNAKIEGTTRYAHRIAWEISGGPIPAGLHVLHRCDQPACVNPSHLFLGTNADNVADKVRKGRQSRAGAKGAANGSIRYPERLARGSKNGNSKLTEADVIGIRLMGANNLSHRKIGAIYGVSGTMVGFILSGKYWAHFGCGDSTR